MGHLALVVFLACIGICYARPYEPVILASGGGDTSNIPCEGDLYHINCQNAINNTGISSYSVCDWHPADTATPTVDPLTNETLTPTAHSGYWYLFFIIFRTCQLVQEHHAFSFNNEIQAATFFGVLVIVIALFLDFSRHTFNEYIESLHSHYYTHLVEHIYGELSTLGILTLLVFIVELPNVDIPTKLENAWSFSHITGHELALMFEYIHLALFCSVVGYIILIAGFMKYANFIVGKWEGWSQISFSDHLSRWKDAYDERDEESWIAQLLDFDYYEKKNGLVYSCFQKHFSIQYGQALPANFDHFFYITQCLRNVSTEIASVHWSVWLFFLFAIFINWLRYTLGGDIQTYIACWVLFGLETLIAVMSLFIYFKTKSIENDIVDEVNFLKLEKAFRSQKKYDSYIHVTVKNDEEEASKYEMELIKEKREELESILEDEEFNIIKDKERLIDSFISKYSRQIHGKHKTMAETRDSNKIKDDFQFMKELEPKAFASHALEHASWITQAFYSCFCLFITKPYDSRSNLEKSFWLGSPTFHIRLFQLVTFFQSIYVAICVYYLVVLGNGTDGHGTVTNAALFGSVFWIPPVIVLTIIFPLSVRSHALVVSMDVHLFHHEVDHAIERCQENIDHHKDEVTNVLANLFKLRLAPAIMENAIKEVGHKVGELLTPLVPLGSDEKKKQETLEEPEAALENSEENNGSDPNVDVVVITPEPAKKPGNVELGAITKERSRCKIFLNV